MPLTWNDMDNTPRVSAGTLGRPGIPAGPGVYAFYRDGKPVYIGKAGSLQRRLWNDHLRQGVSMTNSAMRRNVAESLGIAKAADIKQRRYQPTASDAATISGWIGECTIAWLECATEPDAVALETTLKTERTPRLTKR
jgi:hypothetical protein